MDTYKLSLLLTISSTLILYLLSVLSLLRSILTYKYGFEWIFLSLPLILICPPSVFIIISKCELVAWQHYPNTYQILKAKNDTVAAKLLSILYFILLIAFYYIFNNVFIYSEWSSEISITCDNIVMIFLFLIYYFINRTMKNELNFN